MKANKNTLNEIVLPAPMPDEYSIHFPVNTSSVVPTRFSELLMLHNLRRARRAATSYLESPERQDNTPISRIRDPVNVRLFNKVHIIQQNHASVQEHVKRLVWHLPHPDVLVSVVSFSITPY